VWQCVADVMMSILDAFDVSTLNYSIPIESNIGYSVQVLSRPSVGRHPPKKV